MNSLPVLPRSAPVSVAVAAATDQTAAAMRTQLKRLVADALYLDPTAIDEETSFVELGLDSILAVELVKRLNQELQLNLKATRLYDYANIRALGAYLAEIQLRTDAPESRPQPAPAPEPLSVASPMPPMVVASAATTILDAGEETVYRRLKSLVGEALALDEARIDDELDLFELGLETMAAEKLADGIRREWGISMRGPELLGALESAVWAARFTPCVREGRPRRGR